MKTDVRTEPFVEVPSIEIIYTYHPPKPGQPEIYEMLRSQAKELAYNIFYNCPDCSERYVALLKLQEVIMWANAAIAREGKQ